ncbi:MAG: N-acetylneuraminate synthase family protein [Gammaproteobacteria bacterium]
MPSGMMAIGDRSVGPGHPCFIVAEAALAHEGSLGSAHAFVDVAADAGVDAIKFQTHIANRESSQRERFRVPASSQDRTRFDYWLRTAFTEEQWLELRQHAQARRLVFYSSVFSIAAVDLLERIGVLLWKIPSGEVTNQPLLERIADTKLPVALSTGLGYAKEIDEAVQLFVGRDIHIAVMQATTEYPCPPEHLGLNLLGFFRQRYRCPVGLSDHSGTVYAGIAAAALGADIIETHIAFSREAFGPDIPVSLTPAELRELVKGIRFVERALANPVEKNRATQSLEGLRDLFFHGVVASRDLKAAAILGRDDLETNKPRDGIPASELAKCVGRRLCHDLRAGDPIREEDLE